MDNIALFASHNGSIFDTLYEASIKKELFINISLVISNNSNAPILDKAKENHIPYFVVNDKLYNDTDLALVQLLEKYECKYVVLAGYMKKISPFLANKYLIINSHPALLPKYGGSGMYGRFVHEAVIKNKETISGVTIHKVNENYDEGEIICQKTTQIDSDETTESLENKIKKLEKIAMVEALKLCLK
ncbi:MAG: phosphoribosylglycinamide formyltransferase [Epsilonproteobacteria bacterium]|nr:phosphoribosylglycinamide formyltransferase [Campylobacterota bacterium]